MKYSALIITFLQATLCWDLNAFEDLKFNVTNSECGKRPTNLEQLREKRHSPIILIVGGEEAIPHSWPWAVSVWRNNELDCGGTIINERYVLSAAHCFYGESIRFPKDYMIKVATHTRTDGVECDIEEIKCHPQYNPSKAYYDIALLKMIKVLTFNNHVSPACLPSLGNDYTNENVMVIGWGRHWFNGPKSQVLQQVTVQVVSNTICNEIHSDPLDTFLRRGITDDMLCAGTSEGGKSACTGDSGGPLLHQDPESLKWKVIGIVSFSHKCALPGSPAVYTRVSSFLPWIIENMDM